MCDTRINNNMHEVRPSPRNKRKISAPCPTAYMNPALDLLATEDKICNTAMEVAPPSSKKRKRTKSCTEAFDNSALDLGVCKEAVSAFLSTELRNVHQNLLPIPENVPEQPEYVNVDEIKHGREMSIATNNVASNIMTQQLTEQALCTRVNANNNTSLNLSFIERLGLNSPNLSDRSLYLDDDLNESNIMEIKTITIVTKKKRIDYSIQNSSVNTVNTNPFLNCDFEEMQQNANSLSRSNFPFDLPAQGEEDQSDEIIYNDVSMSDEEHMPSNSTQIQPIEFIPRRLFTGDATNSTMSTVNDISMIHHEPPENLYENIDNYGKDEPVHSVIDNPVFVFSANDNLNKQSKVLGHDVTQFIRKDIWNKGQPLSESSYCSTNSNDTVNSSDGKRNSTILKLPKIKLSSKLSRRVFNKIKNTFKHEKPGVNTTLNPYEVPRKAVKIKNYDFQEGFENPALKLDCSDIDEGDEEHAYECIETSKNTKKNEKVTPLKERNKDSLSNSSNIDTSNTLGRKQVRFDSTLNQEKLITGNSFDSAISSELTTERSDIDNEIEEFHDELENCINEKKFIALNMK